MLKAFPNDFWLVTPLPHHPPKKKEKYIFFLIEEFLPTGVRNQGNGLRTDLNFNLSEMMIAEKKVFLLLTDSLQRLKMMNFLLPYLAFLTYFTYQI